MIEPKIFYRKLDSLLNKIGQEKSGSDFLFTIVRELTDMFGSDLRIANGRIYEEQGTEFVLISNEGSDPAGKTIKIPSASLAVQSVIRSKTYIFDNPNLSIDFEINSKREYTIPAAIMVRSPEHRWILAFELKSGWVREEIDFCFTAVRTATNYRLFSESVKTEKQQADLI